MPIFLNNTFSNAVFSAPLSAARAVKILALKTVASLAKHMCP